MLKFGLEKELFLIKNNKIQIIPLEFPSDECGLLVEARGKPSNNIIDAVYSLKAEEHRIKLLAKTGGYSLDDSPTKKVNKTLKLQATRAYSKGLTHYQNLYGILDHRNLHDEQTAGIHISFTQEETFSLIGKQCPLCKYSDIKDRTFNKLFDFVQIFRTLDNKFKTEIKLAKRNPGFYEIKPDSRVEYRSLPSNTNLDKIIDVFVEIFPQSSISSSSSSSVSSKGE
jgi:hypothetical protein